MWQLPHGFDSATRQCPSACITLMPSGAHCTSSRPARIRPSQFGHFPSYLACHVNGS
jgi:hypothetical protein